MANAMNPLRTKLTNKSTFFKPDMKTAILAVDNYIIPEHFAKGLNAVKKFMSFNKAGDTSKNFELSKIKMTKNIKEVRTLLAPDMVQAYIMSGEDSVNYLLLPFLSQFFHSTEIISTEKKAKVEQLRNDFKECERIHNEEFDAERKSIQAKGMYYFEANVNTVIKPYTL
jgi:hypothetical protein